MDQYRPPSTDLLPPDDDADPDFVAVRKKNARPESWIRGVGLFNCLFSLAWIYNICYYGSLLLGVMLGKVSAPWLAEPYFIFALVSSPLLAALALFAGYGLYHLKPWASGVEAAYVLLWFAYAGLSIAREFAERRPISGLMACLVLAGWSMPTLALLAPGVDEVMSPDYQEIIAKAPIVRTKTRLPLWVVIAMILLNVMTVPLLFSIEGMKK